MLSRSILRIAHARAPEGPTRWLLSRMIRMAGVLEDMMARAQYLEGLLDLTPGTLSRNPRAPFKAAREAAAASPDAPTGNAIVDTLRDHGMPEQDIFKMVGPQDAGVHQALIRGSSQALGSAQAVRGLQAEDLAAATFAGISALTYKTMKYGPGRGAFHYLGDKGKGRSLRLRGIISVASKEAFNRAMDVVRKTRKEEMFPVGLNQPVQDNGGSSTQTVADILVDPEGPSNTFRDLAEAVFRDSRILRSMSQLVEARLTTESQEFVWEAIKQNPGLLIISRQDVGVEARALAKKVAEISGKEYKGKSSDVSARKTFKTKVLPAMQAALSESAVVRQLMRSREIQEVIEESVGSPPMSRSLPRVRRVAMLYSLRIASQGG